MNRKQLYVIILAIIVILSCDENFVIVNCSECLGYDPLEAQIIITLDDNNSYNGKVMIYEGNVEDSILLMSSIIYSESMEFTVQINKKYAIRVDYQGKNGKRYTAINSIYPRVRFEADQCSNGPCFYIYDNKINMKLKYE
jgi:hypothetical protein